MLRRRSFRWLVPGFVAMTVFAGLVPPAVAVPAYDFATPVFGLAAHGTKLFVADTGAGIVRLTEETGRLIVEHPGVTDVAPLGRGRMWILASAPHDRKLYLVDGRRQREIARLGAFERENNPDEGVTESNPFDLAALGGGEVLIADAAGNDVLIANRQGEVDWVATLPQEMVSTDHAKTLAGCPDAPPDLAFICELPEEIPADAVPTSVAVGPDGAYYVTELKGIPATPGESRVWRIEPGSRHVHCDEAGMEPACSVVADGFTSAVDITFGPDGTAYVVELDEASFLALEIAPEQSLGGTVNACDATWTCTVRATELSLPMAAAVDASGTLFAVVAALIPEAAEVIELA